MTNGATTEARRSSITARDYNSQIAVEDTGFRNADVGVRENELAQRGIQRETCEQASKTFDAAHGALVDLGEYVSKNCLGSKGERTNCRINFVALETRDVDFKSSRRILCQSDFIRGRTPRHIDRIRLAHHGYDSTWIRPDAIAIVGTAWRVNIEPGENLRRRTVETKNNLDATVGILC